MRARQRGRGGSLLRTLTTGAVLILGVWGVSLFVFAAAMPVTVERPDVRTDAIVVLTGGSGRLRAGLDLLIADKADQMFVSGVYRGVDVTQLLAVQQQRPEAVANRISIGNADNTVENASETGAWMAEQRFSSLRLVTAAYHMPRSLLEFRAVMPDVEIVPHPVFPEHVKQEEWWAWPGTTALTISEFNKFLFAWLRLRVEAVQGLIGTRSAAS